MITTVSVLADADECPTEELVQPPATSPPIRTRRSGLCQPAPLGIFITKSIGRCDVEGMIDVNTYLPAPLHALACESKFDMRMYVDGVLLRGRLRLLLFRGNDPRRCTARARIARTWTYVRCR